MLVCHFKLYDVNASFCLIVIGIISSAGIVAAMKNPKMYQSTQHHVDIPEHQGWLQQVLGGKAVEVKDLYIDS